MIHLNLLNIQVIRSIFWMLVMVVTILAVKGQTLVHQTTDTSNSQYAGVEGATYYDGSWLTAFCSSTPEGFIPSIIRLDTAGKIIWNSGWLETPAYRDEVRLNRMMISDDGFLYIVWQTIDEDIELIWKTDLSNGRRIWSKEVVHVSANNCKYAIHDIDATRILVLRQNYYNQGVINGSIIGFYINRFTGEFSQEYALTRSTQQTSVASELDYQKNLIVTSGDTVYKYYGSNLDSLIWVSPFQGAKVVYFTHAVIDSASNRIVLAGFGKLNWSDQGVLVSMDLTTGASDTFYFTGAYYNCVKIKIYNEHVYSSWRAWVSNTQPMHLVKVKLNDFSLKWNFVHVIVSSGNAINDFCFDSSGHIYATGHYRDGNWFIVKLLDSNAGIVCTQTFTLDTTRWDRNSRGKYICFLNKRVYSFGDMQYNYLNPTATFGYYRPALVVMDTGCKIEKMDLLEDLIRTHTAVIQILNSPTGEATVLSKIGNGLELTRYDSSLKEKWRHRIYSGEYLFNGSLYEDEAGDIGLTCYSRKLYVHYPFYQIYQDTLIFYRYSSSGSLKNKNRFYSGSVDYRPFDALMDTGKAVIFSILDSSCFLHLTSPTALGSPSGPGFKADTLKIRFKFSYNLNDSTAILVGRTTGSARIYRLNKYSGQLQVLDTLPSVLWHVNQVVHVDSGTLFLGGFSQSGKASSGLYDFNLEDTLWTRVILPQVNSKLILVDLDSVNSMAYLAVQKGAAGAVVAQNLKNGNVNWVRDYAGFDSGYYGITDLRYNTYTGDVNVSGYESNTEEGIARMMRFDTSGKVIDDYRLGYREMARNRANTVGIMSDSSAWFGGQKQNAVDGSFGFIYKMNGCFRYKTDTISSCSYILSPGGNETYFQTGWFIDTLPGGQNCDTIVHIWADIRSTNKHISLEGCDSVISPSARQIWRTSGLYLDTLQNAGGCDSVLTIRVTVLSSKFSSVTWTVCDGVASPGNSNWWNQTGVYFDTISTTKSCDSVIQVNLTVLLSSYSSLKWFECDSALSPSAKYVWDKSGVFYDTLVNNLGCDSIVQVDLTILSTTTRITEHACYSYLSPSSKYTWTQSGTYHDTLVNSVGCDSLMEFELHIHGRDSSSRVLASCIPVLALKGQYWYHTTGLYLDTLQTSYGCDSIIQTHFVLSGAMARTLSVDACSTYVSPYSGKTYSSSGTYADTVSYPNTCDTVYTYQITIHHINNLVVDSMHILFSKATGVQYQWLDCGSNWSPINGANGQTFVPSVNGSYAVEVEDAHCIDTSSCISIGWVGIPYVSSGTVQVYPNPNDGVFQVESIGNSNLEKVSVYSMNGSLCWEEVAEGKLHLIDAHRILVKGIYLIRVVLDNGIHHQLIQVH